jgi:hypothetical protein
MPAKRIRRIASQDGRIRWNTTIAAEEMRLIPLIRKGQ